MEYFEFVAEAEDVGCRLDVFLSHALSDATRNGVQKLIEQGYVLVQGKSSKSNYKLRLADKICAGIPPAKEVEILAEDIPLSVLFEDAHLIVVDKPQGMVVHPAYGHYSGTLVNALLYHCKGQLSGINGELRPGIVHRIDKDTSGALVVAKTDQAHQFLSLQLAEHAMTRKYLAVVYNRIREDCGTVDAPIGRHQKDRKRMAVTDKHSRRAVTHYHVIDRFGNFNLIEAQLETGRTHQIRVHMAHIGHPLLGDTVYGPQKQPFSLQGQALHAKVLGFIHPVTKEYLEFVSPLPVYFEKLLQRLRLEREQEE